MQFLPILVMTPVWIFTLGKVIFDSANLKVPYHSIGESVFALIVPLLIGSLISRYFPRAGRFLVRILKPASSLLIIFIVVFAIVTNLYLFKLFTWQVRRCFGVFFLNESLCSDKFRYVCYEDILSVSILIVDPSSGPFASLVRIFRCLASIRAITAKLSRSFGYCH